MAESPFIPIIEERTPRGRVLEVDVSIPKGYRVTITDRGEYLVAEPSKPDEGEYRRLQAVLEDYLYTGRDLEELMEEHAVSKDHRYIIEREYEGFSILEPLLLDRRIVDVHVVGGKPVKVVHQDYGPLETNIVLPPERVGELASRLAARAGKPLSERRPLTTFVDPETDMRVSVVVPSDVTLWRGATLDIRKQLGTPWTILRLIKVGTVSPREAAFLWAMVEYKQAMLVVGPMFSGKTTMINAVLNFIPPTASVITIEDAPELRVPVPFWTRTVTREPMEEGGEGVSVFDLIKLAVRLSVDYMIVGEVRGEEARHWAQAILLGHGGVTSLHAESPDAALRRLQQPPINVGIQALEALRVFVQTTPVATRGRLARASAVYVREEDGLRRIFSCRPGSSPVEPSIKDLASLEVFKAVQTLSGLDTGRLAAELWAREEIITSLYKEYEKKDPSLAKVDSAELNRRLYAMLEEWRWRVEG